MTFKKKLILLADDDEDDRGFFIKAMAEIDPSIVVASVVDGDKLMKELYLMPLAPDLIFLDLNMPLKNGLECLAEIARADELRKIPVIIYSTSISPAEVDDAWHNGACCFVRKPDSYGLLMEILAKIIGIDFNAVGKKRKEKFNFELGAD